MTATPNVCQKCGTALSSDVASGLCVKCLLAAGLAESGANPTESHHGSHPAGFRVLPAAEVQQWFPHLEVIELLGQGGMGVVYRARQPVLDRQVAVKILPPQAARDPAFAERFAREARAMARLNHPHIVTV